MSGNYLSEDIKTCINQVENEKAHQNEVEQRRPSCFVTTCYVHTRDNMLSPLQWSPMCKHRKQMKQHRFGLATFLQ